MASNNRRRFFKMAGAAVLAAAATGRVQQATSTPRSGGARDYGGVNLAGWQIAVGDGVYTAPGEDDVSLQDIETVHFDTYSELRANIRQRDVMAHNITYRSLVDESAFDFIHRCGYKFRLPYLPAPDNEVMNAQTIEGGLFIWDGSDTRLDYGLAFQWILNPWSGPPEPPFGTLQCWTSRGDGAWQPVAMMEPDTEWHEIVFLLECRRETTAMLIDGIHYPVQFTTTAKPENWGTETAARLQVEIISIYPGPTGDGKLHKAEVKDWFWHWAPHTGYQTFLPAVGK